MKLAIDRIIDGEIVHYWQDDAYIASKSVSVFDGRELFRFPIAGWRSVAAKSRLVRRALRLDKCNVLPVEGGMIAVRDAAVYHFDGQTLRKTLSLVNCRNPLHQSICQTDEGVLYFGEYGSNPDRGAVPIYRSVDQGKSWETAYAFEPGEIRHIHGCYWDRHEQAVWILTGDLQGECYLCRADKRLDTVEKIGDGSQSYRACNAFFQADSVHWLMDSPHELSYHMRLDRKSGRVERLSLLPGPAWYLKRLDDGYFLAGTTKEPGIGSTDSFAHLLATKDLDAWHDLKQFKPSFLSGRHFKFSVIGFADGRQSSDRFPIFFESIKGLDGKTAVCRIEDEAA